MTVEIGQAIEEGFKRTLARNGLYLVGVMWVLSVLNGLFGNTIARNAFQQFEGQMGPGMAPGMGPGGAVMGPGLGLSTGLAAALSTVLGLVGLVVVLAAFRTFVSDDQETLPIERFSRNLGWAWVNLLIGWIVFWIVVGIGFVFLLVPGLFLLVSLLFWGVYVAVEDQNFVEGFQNSWQLARGNRLRLFATGVLVVIISLVVSWVFGIPQLAGLTGWIGLLLGQIGTAVTTVFVLATISRTYVQLIASTEAAAA